MLKKCCIDPLKLPYEMGKILSTVRWKQFFPAIWKQYFPSHSESPGFRSPLVARCVSRNGCGESLSCNATAMHARQSHQDSSFVSLPQEKTLLQSSTLLHLHLFCLAYLRPRDIFYHKIAFFKNNLLLLLYWCIFTVLNFNVVCYSTLASSRLGISSCSIPKH